MNAAASSIADTAPRGPEPVMEHPMERPAARPTARIGRTAILSALALALALGSGTWLARAMPVGWSVARDDSRILFDYRRNGQSAEGRFTRFTGEGVFDRASPADATLELHIESASIDLDDPLASAFATSAEWFDSMTHPELVYRLQHLTPEGGDRFRADGDLTIRGRTKPISTTITLNIGAESASASGTLSVDRTDYLLGVGPSAMFVDIGPQVSVRFELTAQPSL
jgi:polyisoprenoid-binding protein YceI